MIRHQEISDLAAETSLREEVIEKDYVIGWVLWGIGAEPRLSDSWVFKGGTCLKKCFIETYRFSEDLDFTVLPGGPVDPDDVSGILDDVIGRVESESGLDLSSREPYLKSRSAGSTEGRIYYIGPCGRPTPSRIKLDLLQDEVVVQPPVLRRIHHGFSDELPDPAVVRTYGFEEVFAEKLRALGERTRPRDLYDVINLYRRSDFRDHPGEIRDVLIKKCLAKGVKVPTLDDLEISPHRPDLESEWESMLAHQLPMLPPFDAFWAALEDVFRWLAGDAIPLQPEKLPLAADHDKTWTPPPMISSWGVGAPIESVRFAAANHLCVELGYLGRVRTIEPYSLRRTQEGNILLHAIRIDSRQHRSYRVDRIESVRITNLPFQPTYEVEFPAYSDVPIPSTPQRPSTARKRGKAAARRSSRSSRPRPRSTGPKYLYRCPVCNKVFRRQRNDPMLRPHKNKQGYDCYARGYAIFVRIQY